MRQDAEYLDTIGLQREAVANVEQIHRLAAELNGAKAVIAARDTTIARLVEALKKAVNHKWTVCPWCAMSGGHNTGCIGQSARALLSELEIK